jgi:hypothetical protein
MCLDHRCAILEGPIQQEMHYGPDSAGSFSENPLSSLYPAFSIPPRAGCTVATAGAGVAAHHPHMRTMGASGPRLPPPVMDTLAHRSMGRKCLAGMTPPLWTQYTMKGRSPG